MLGTLVFSSRQWAERMIPIFLSLSVAEIGAVILVAIVFRKWQQALGETHEDVRIAARLADAALGRKADSVEEPQLQTLLEELTRRVQDSNKTVQNLQEQLLEQKKSMRELVDKAVDVICIINAQGQIVSVNNACETAWGYKPASLVGQSLYSLLQEGKADEVMPAALGAMYSINKIVFESRLRKANGQWLDVILTGHWSASEAGFFCIIHDISEQKAFERLKSDFISMVAHDIRTPLASVSMFCELAEQGALGIINEKGIRLIGLTRAKCERLLRLLNDMLQLDKMQAGSFDLQLANVDMAAVMHDCIETVSPSAQIKAIEIEESGKSAVCWGDELRLTQVVLNLLANAIKYAPERSTIAVQVEERPDCVVLSVADHGQGIPQDKLEKIFERFEQVSAEDARQRQGIGLGLAICKAIVVQHGGRIGVDSRIGQGSKFWFAIPKKPSEVHQQPQTLPS